MIPRMFLALVLVVVSFVWAPESHAQDAKALTKQLKTAIKTELSELSTAIKAKGPGFFIAISAALVATDPTVALAIEDAMGDYIADVAGCADAAKDDLQVTLAILTPALAADTPMDFYYGGGGVLDGFLTKIAQGAGKIEKKLVKTVAKVVTIVTKANPNLRITFYAKILDVSQPPDPLGNVGPKALAISTMAAASDVTVANDGQLCVGGLANPLAGNVTVSITGPNGNVTQLAATVDALTCRWTVCFTGVEESSYIVQADQAGNLSKVEAIGVP